VSIGLRSPWTLGAGAAGLAALAAILGTVMALLGAQLACVGGGGGVAGGRAPAPSRVALGEIPAARLHIYEAAGRRFDIDWAFLASIGYQECGHGACHFVSPSGCAGPMEIAYVRGSACSPGPGPTIWERYEVDADGGGASIFDPADAVFTAARILRQALGAPPTGGSYAAYHEAACRYYGACADSVADYADEVMHRAVEYGFGAAAEAAPAAAQGSTCEGSALAADASGSAIVRVARSQLGREEHPPGSNCTRYGPCEEWCALFVAWVWQRAGIRMRGGTAPYAYSGSFYGWVREHGGRVLPAGATPTPGDAVLFGWGPRASEHVGIVEQVLPGGQITTIDGNFGDRVARVGPFLPSLAVASGAPAPIYAYAEPPGIGGGQSGG
jgi:CHAP domain